ncbi:MAG: hypothetical protein ACK5P7_03460 [Bdellovibrio sp.]|jgi:hypothetical protein
MKAEFANARLGSSIDLSYEPRNETQQEYQERQQKLAKANAEQKELIRQIKQNCQFNQPEEITENSGELRVGAQNKWQKNSAIFGAGCPVQHQSQSSTVMTVRELVVSGNNLDLLAGDVQGRMTLNSMVIDPVWMARANVSGVSLQGGFQGVIRLEKNQMKTWLKGAFSGYYQLQNRSRIPITAELENLNTEAANGRNVTLMVYKMARPQGTVELYQVETESRGVKQSEYYLNSQPISKQEVDDIFQGGFNFEGQVL